MPLISTKKVTNGIEVNVNAIAGNPPLVDAIDDIFFHVNAIDKTLMPSVMSSIMSMPLTCVNAIDKYSNAIDTHSSMPLSQRGVCCQYFGKSNSN